MNLLTALIPLTDLTFKIPYDVYQKAIIIIKLSYKVCRRNICTNPGYVDPEDVKVIAPNI